MDCTESSIQLHSGVFFDPFNPDPSKITIEDMAASLSEIPRYMGHLNARWSIAHHSLLVACITPDPDKLASLLHDGPDMIMGDLGSPIKYHPTLAGYLQLELALKAIFAGVFHIPFPYPAATRRADLIATYAEAVELHHGVEEWTKKPADRDWFEIDFAQHMLREIIELPDIKTTFLNQFTVLTGGDVHA